MPSSCLSLRTAARFTPITVPALTSACTSVRVYDQTGTTAVSLSLSLSLTLSFSLTFRAINLGRIEARQRMRAARVCPHRRESDLFLCSLPRGGTHERQKCMVCQAFSAPRVQPHLTSMLCSSHPLTHAPQHPRPLTLLSRGRRREGHRREVATHERGAQPAGGEVCPRC